MYHNEADVETARTAEEVVALLEGEYDIVEIDPLNDLSKASASTSIKPPKGSKPAVVSRKQF